MFFFAIRGTCPSFRLFGGCGARPEFGVRSPQPRDRCPTPCQRSTKTHLPDWLVSVKTGGFLSFVPLHSQLMASNIISTPIKLTKTIVNELIFPFHQAQVLWEWMVLTCIFPRVWYAVSIISDQLVVSVRCLCSSTFREAARHPLSFIFTRMRGWEGNVFYISVQQKWFSEPLTHRGTV